MRYSDLTEAKQPSIGDYTAAGIDEPTAEKYLGAKIKPELASAYHRTAQEYGIGFEEILRGHKDNLRRKREDRAYEKLVAGLPQLAAATTPLTAEQACAIIANDDTMFDAICTHIYGDPDWFENTPQDAVRLAALIVRIKPFKHPPLYRGECSYGSADAHTRSFHSWTVARDTADYFWKDCGRGRGRLLRLTVPVRAIDLGEVGLWRGRLRQESHYIGSQGEWLVPDGYPYTVIAQT